MYGGCLMEKKRDQNKRESPHTKGTAPRHQGGDHIRKAQQWAGGNKAAKGSITKADRKNENSSAKS
jgi:hypothetical protein